jgi:hypothetical protein
MKSNNSSSSSSLWDNDMVKNATKSMSKNDLEKYAKLGESFYKDVDYETSTIIDKNNIIPPFMKNAVKYVEESLKSGLHPSMMTKEEVELMKEIHGAKWYEIYGYVEGDLTDFVTLKKQS